MALSALQARVARLALRLPEAKGFMLAGGGAMLAHGLLDRPTHLLPGFPAAFRPPAFAPMVIPSIEADHHEASTGIHDRSLFRSSPRLRPRMEQGRFGFFPELRTPRLPATHVKAGTSHGHRLKATQPT